MPSLGPGREEVVSPGGLHLWDEAARQESGRWQTQDSSTSSAREASPTLKSASSFCYSPSSPTPLSASRAAGQSLDVSNVSSIPPVRTRSWIERSRGWARRRQIRRATVRRRTGGPSSLGGRQPVRLRTPDRARNDGLVSDFGQFKSRGGTGEVADVIGSESASLPDPLRVWRDRSTRALEGV